MSVQLTNEPDRFKWRLTTSGVFSVKSLYADFLNDRTKYLQKYLWKMKVPLKIKIFMWFLHRKVILTKDNLLKRSWSGCPKCALCTSHEKVKHLFIRCPFANIKKGFLFSCPQVVSCTQFSPAA
jgi:hypothetical protein